MAGGLVTTSDVNRIEAPVTWKAYLICAFASFGGIFFGYDSGYINGVNGSSLFYKLVDGPDAEKLSSSHQSLVVSILSAGTFFGAIIAGDVAERIGRKWTVVAGCFIYIIGVVVQMITGPEVDALGAIVAGRLIAGLGVGFESAIVILYMSEIVSYSMPALQINRINPNNPSFSAPRKFVVLSSLVTSSVSPSVSSWLPVSSTRPKAAKIPDLTVSQLRFNSPGV
jgi:MFS family permease